ncbi:hypothetical protein C7377_1803 [Balneicella halophila]|uniref:Lipoprotein n=1 Tax=Balneicella halophila TaxID=1537566 RepID=A0A7L4UNB6_BALHA|nr:hypothetical protein [Balneicella halophila]PVX49387.1 hypothetical protein C7377_1803 [Balneicella halophila]
MNIKLMTLSIILLTLVSWSGCNNQNNKEKNEATQKENVSQQSIDKTDTVEQTKSNENSNKLENIVHDANGVENEETSLYNSLESSPSNIMLGKSYLTLNSRLHLDLMPSPEPDHKPSLFINISLVDRTDNSIPEDLSVDKIYLIQDTTINEVAVEKVFNKSNSEKLILNYNGPKLDTKKKVDIVLELSLEGEIYRISQRAQKIMVTH